MIVVTSIDRTIADALASIPRLVVPDMPDRIIAATALSLGLPLVTRDTEILRLTNVTTVW
jgi:predicted nucleic acid-binding protein